MQRIKAWIIIPLMMILSACSDERSVEEVFSETLMSMELAAQQKDVGEFMTFVSKIYSDSEGRSWHDIRRIAQIYFLRNKEIHIYKHITRLRFSNESTAEAVIFVALAGQPIDSVASISNIRAELMQFKVIFVFDETWQIRSAQWKPAELSNFLN